MLKTFLFIILSISSSLLKAEDNPQYLETLEISNGHNHVCALTTAGVKCFGNAELITTKVPLNLKNPRNVTTGNRFTCAIVDDGIRCWGEIPNTNKTDILINNNTLPKAKLLALGFEHYCAVAESNIIKCWGRNEHNEINPPEQLTNITELSLGMNNSCVIADSKVVCWGMAVTGSTDVPANLINPRNLTSGLWHHCVQTDEGMKCWGNPYKAFVTPDDPAIKDFTSGGLFNCAIVDAGVKCWDELGKTQLVEGSAGATKLSVGSTVACAVTTSTGVICWKLSDKGALKPLISFVPAGGITQIDKIATGHGSTCLYGDGDKLKCWGANFDQALNVPSTVPGPLAQLSVGAHKTCAIKDTTLSCWGDPHSAYRVPSSLKETTFVSSGGNHICAGTNEKVKCWGDNFRGALKVPAELTNFTQLTSGILHSCAVTNNEVTCWGGEGLIKDVNPPTKMVNPKAICAGATFSCGIDESGKVQCWGEQIPLTHMGVNRKQANEILNVPSDIVGATEISCGVSHGCAIYNGKIKCWGSGAYMPDRLVAPPRIENPRMLSAGWNHTCALGDKGLSCWGKMIGMEMPAYSLVK